MNLDEHPILFAYLMGCLFAFFLHFVVIAETYLVTWFFKGNILRRNLKKIQDPEGQGFKVEAGIFAINLTIVTVSSWLAVLQFTFQIVWIPMKVLREAFASVPEEIKSIRFPLLNNPDLSREAVWAYLYALNTKGGVTPNSWEINNDLYGVGAYYPSFNKQSALEILGSLKVVDQEILSNAASIIEEKKREWEEVSANI